jgi:hypothetical protein
VTMDCERFWSIRNTRRFLLDLLEWEGPMRKGEIRTRAYACLRHFPEDYWLKEFEKVWENHKAVK